MNTSGIITPDDTAHIITTKTAHGRLISRLVRAACYQSGTPYPITMKPGDAPPKLYGERSHHTTRGGSRIWHPSAYSKRGWSNMIYINSTLEIIVGRDWIVAELAATAAKRRAAAEAKRQQQAAVSAALDLILSTPPIHDSRVAFTAEGGFSIN